MDDADYITGPAKVLAELQTLRSEVAELREALEVFAAKAAQPHIVACDDEDAVACVAVREFRRAAAVLAKHKG